MSASTNIEIESLQNKYNANNGRRVEIDVFIDLDIVCLIDFSQTAEKSSQETFL